MKAPTAAASRACSATQDDQLCLKAVVDSACNSDGTLAGERKPEGPITASLGSSNVGTAAAGISWQATVLQGLADYLSTRAQQETVLWLEQDVLAKFCAADAIPVEWPNEPTAKEPLPPATKYVLKLHWSDLFTTTCHLVSSDTTHLGTTFAAALRADLTAFPVRLGGALAHIDDDLLTLLVADFTAIQGGASPLEVLAGLADDDTVKNKCKDTKSVESKGFACGLQILGAAVKWGGDAQAKDPSKFEGDLDSLAAAFVAAYNDECQTTQGCEATVASGSPDRQESSPQDQHSLQPPHRLAEAAGGDGCRRSRSRGPTPERRDRRDRRGATPSSLDRLVCHELALDARCAHGALQRDFRDRSPRACATAWRRRSLPRMLTI